MKKVIEMSFTLTELKMIASALNMGGGGKAYYSLLDKVEETIESNEESQEISLEEWHEKYGAHNK